MFSRPVNNFRLLFLRLLLCTVGCAGFSTANGQEYTTDSTEEWTDSTVVEAPAEDSEVVADPGLDFFQRKVEDSAILRSVDDSIVSRLQKDRHFSYANDPEFWKNEPIDKKVGENALSRFLRSDAVVTTFYVLLVALFLFILIRVAIANNLIGSRRKNTVLQEADELEQLDDEGLENRLRQAIQAKEYRQGVRLLYLITLRALDQKGWIRYHAESTNSDYRYQLKDHGVAKEFDQLTYIYDYVWYGEYPLSEELFAQAHQYFDQFNKKIVP